MPVPYDKTLNGFHQVLGDAAYSFSAVELERLWEIMAPTFAEAVNGVAENCETEEIRKLMEEKKLHKFFIDSAGQW